MIPVSNLKEIEIKQEPDKTWCVVDGEHLNGFIDGIEAVAQAIYFMLNTERYVHEIYSWDYGVDFDDLFGQPPEYCFAEIKRRIEETLLTDDRINSVEDFSFSSMKGAVEVVFTVVTIYGELKSGKVVNI